MTMTADTRAESLATAQAAEPREIADVAAAEGLSGLPVCMAKTPLSFSHDPSLHNAPSSFTLPIRSVRAYTGAGWLVAHCGDVLTMPGLPTDPVAAHVDIDAEGRTVGLW